MASMGQMIHKWAKSGFVFEFDLSLFELLHLVHGDIFIDKFIDFLIHLLGELSACNPSEAHNEKDDEYHYRHNSEYDPVGQVGVVCGCACVASRRSWIHAFANSLEHLVGL